MKLFGTLKSKIDTNEDKPYYVEDKVLLQNPGSPRLNSWHAHLTTLLGKKLLLFNQRYWQKYARKQ